ncbi:hypothetical protein [Natronorubrum sp. FCH18a]|uniref:hypothetical protein n=1 Tax=Natronorubrum sp. FCH18a TaxID=3447018 RepID=UPI003F50D7C9
MSVQDADAGDQDDAVAELTEWDERALTQYLTVLEDIGRARGADGLYLVVSQAGKEYLVDADVGACECPDYEYRNARCKHLRRVDFATGRRPLPAGIDLADVDDQLGEHISGWSG